MRTAIWIVFVLVWGGILLWLVVYPLLVRWQVARNLFDLLDAHSAGTWAKFRVAASGLKRLLFGRIVWVTGLMLSMHDVVVANVVYVEPFVPEKYRQYLLPTIMLIGVITELLNRISQQPVGEISPDVLAKETKQPLQTVLIATVNDPNVGIPTQAQLAEIPTEARGDPYTGTVSGERQ